MSSLGIFDKETKTYKKIAGLAEAATVDDALSTTSTNPIQNKVVTNNLTDIRKETTVNLLKPTLQTTTKNGVTCTDNGDGTYTLNGTASGRAIFAVCGENYHELSYFAGNAKIIKQIFSEQSVPGSDGNYANGYYFAMQGKDQMSNIYIDEIVVDDYVNKTYRPIINVSEGITVNNLVIKPMLTTNLSATYDDFVPYTGSTGKLNGDVAALKAEVANNKTVVDEAMSDTSINPVQNKVIKAYVDKEVSENVDFSTSTSKTLNDTVEAPLVLSKATRNLFNPTLATTTKNGITCTNNGDGTYTLNGTSTKDEWISFADVTLNPGKYKFIATENNVRVSNLCVSLNHETIAIPGSKFTIQSKSVCSIGLSTHDETFNNVLIKPMITTDLDATYDDFVPYSGYDIKTCGKNLLNVKSISENQLDATEPTDFEPYQDGGTVHIDSTTEFPLLGLKSFNGETNIISPGNVEVTYAKSDSGKAILDMSENKLDKDDVVNNQTTTEEGFALDARQANPNVEGSLGAQIKAVKKETTVNLLNPDLETTTKDGITCTNNGDGTYTLNGTVSSPSNRAVIVIQHWGDMIKRHLNEELLLIGCPKHDKSIYVVLHLDAGLSHAVDSGNGDIFKFSQVAGNGAIKIEIGPNGTTVNNLVFKPMITTNLNATYDDFVSYTGDTGKLNSDVAVLAKKVPVFVRNDSVFNSSAGHSPVITGDTAGRFSEISDEWSDDEGRVIKFKNNMDTKTHITIYANVPVHNALFLQAYSPSGASVEVTGPLFFYTQSSDDDPVQTIACDVTAPIGTEVSIAFNPIVIKNV